MGVSLEHNEEKANLPKKSPIIRKYKYQKLRRKLVVDAKFCPGYYLYFSILGLGPICDEFRIWASNLVLFFLLIYLLSL